MQVKLSITAKYGYYRGVKQVPIVTALEIVVPDGENEIDPQVGYDAYMLAFMARIMTTVPAIARCSSLQMRATSATGHAVDYSLNLLTIGSAVTMDCEDASNDWLFIARYPDRAARKAIYTYDALMRMYEFVEV